MALNDTFQQLEPEDRELSENAPFVRDLIGQDVVKGRDAVCGHQQQLVSQVIEVPHLALGRRCNGGDG